ncbi:NAD(+)--dinitrogen-reductase ADP-D-ribosyltransferase [Ideonella sp. A 288]|uniref:NAD(+)--dinitrogen-reductase ADP-D-ribosyltransferase n=1 Tax=Ideonella sp. A 288 TaxID=1962181 RepID=UPI000B4AB059|nr:NAD(+)--dinitrogen-reductase ADP-D-ribosyltransferase [Ideonella sp. A 288]
MTDEARGDAANGDAAYRSTLVGVAAHVLASTAFNATPKPLHIAGTRESHAELFDALDRCGAADEARVVFDRFMAQRFGAGEVDAPGRRRRKASHLKLLQGWGMDASGAAGAVLKGWVESRFGLMPAWHGERLGRFPSPAWVRYIEDKAGTRYHDTRLWGQIDLLFEYCQWMLARFELLGPGPHATLWRGSTRVEEQLVAGSLRERHCTVRLNNLVSFSRTREQAGCFGDWVFEARVPMVKLLFVPGLVDSRALDGEAEVLAVGGDYEVGVSYAC